MCSGIWFDRHAGTVPDTNGNTVRQVYHTHTHSSVGGVGPTAPIHPWATMESRHDSPRGGSRGVPSCSYECSIVSLFLPLESRVCGDSVRDDGVSCCAHVEYGVGGIIDNRFMFLFVVLSTLLWFQYCRKELLLAWEKCMAIVANTPWPRVLLL